MDSDKTDDSSSAHSNSSIADIKEVKCATPIAKEMIVELDVVETKVVVTESTEDTAVNGSLSSGEILSGKRSAGVPDMWSFILEGQDGDSISDILSTEDAGSIRKESLLDKLFGSAPPTIINDVVLPSDLLRDEVFYILHDIPYILFLLSGVTSGYAFIFLLLSATKILGFNAAIKEFLRGSFHVGNLSTCVQIRRLKVERVSIHFSTA